MLLVVRESDELAPSPAQLTERNGFVHRSVAAEQGDSASELVAQPPLLLVASPSLLLWAPPSLCQLAATRETRTSNVFVCAERVHFEIRKGNR